MASRGKYRKQFRTESLTRCYHFVGWRFSDGTFSLLWYHESLLKTWIWLATIYIMISWSSTKFSKQTSWEWVMRMADRKENKWWYLRHERVNVLLVTKDYCLTWKIKFWFLIVNLMSLKNEVKSELFRKFGTWSTNHALIDIFLYSHPLSVWYCIDTVRRI